MSGEERLGLPTSGRRVLWLDGVKVFLIVLVLAHHSAITYGAAGSWYYHDEAHSDLITKGLLSLFVAVNQSYFMGLFFLISSYFMPGSVQRKGVKLFTRDRLIRFGIPIVVYMGLIDPFVDYLSMEPHQHSSFAKYLAFYHGIGPLWFLEALLIFTAVYLLVRRFNRRQEASDPNPFPSRAKVLGYICVLAVASFAIRLWFPIGVNVASLQLAYFPQYVAMFWLGLVFRRHEWMESLTDQTSRFWFRVSVVFIIVFLILIPVLLRDHSVDLFGGMHWQAAVLALWEQLVAVGLCLRILTFARKHAERPGRWLQWMSANAFTVYIIHPIFVVGAAVVFTNLPLYGLLKWALLVAVAVPLSFLSSHYVVRRIPFAKRVLG